jgi:hypothetical protein
LASSAAAKSSKRESQPLSAALSETLQTVKGFGSEGLGLDPPATANAFVAAGSAHARLGRTARARLAAWKTRVARGLAAADGFGAEAAALRRRVLGAFDAGTLSAAGLPPVAPYRQQLRRQLQQCVDAGIEEVFAGQVANLEAAAVKRFRAQLLRTLSDEPAGVESAMDANAAALRNEAFAFEKAMEDLEVPVLGLTKDRAVRELAAKLNDALVSFPDSPAAKLKRTQQAKKVVEKEKTKPGKKRSIGWGIDLVAMLRPDGFGSFQGFAGYQLPGGNSITLGVHNDADDPQVISQFGGVRPPLLRVQPKLRLDVEL